jgi:hypothetical protein
MMKNNRNENAEFYPNSIKKIVWDGPYVETDEGRMVRGAVGLTHIGNYRAAQVTLYREHGPASRVAHSAEDWQWNQKPYAYKEQAIFVARESVAHTVRNDQQIEGPVREGGATHGSVAKKYGDTSQALQRELPPPSLSR